MTVLVTGAGGFVATHLIDELCRLGLGPVIAADVSAPPQELLAAWGDRVRPVTLDVTNLADVKRVVAETRPDLVVHGAAITPDLDEERQSPGQICAVNFGGSANVIEACQHRPNIRRVILFSSSGVYNGLQPYPPRLTEDGELPAIPSSLYAVTKIACEGLAARAHATSGLSVAAIRVAAVYGHHERATHSRRFPRTSLIHRLSCALQANEELQAGGEDVGRDWLHGDDAARAIAGLLTAPVLNHLVYNVGSGRLSGWHDILNAFRAEGLRTSQTIAPSPFIMVQGDGRPPLDIARLAADTGFAPRIDIVSGIRDLVSRQRKVRQS